MSVTDGANDRLRRVLLTVRPDTHALLALDHFLDEEYIFFYDAPEYEDVRQILTQWADGKANAHMTVLRLRKLTEVA